LSDATQAARRWRELQRLSGVGRPLGPDSEHRTRVNRQLFVPGDGWPLQPIGARRALHQGLLRAWRQRYPHRPGERRAIVLAGPPGAGKSTACAALMDASGIPRAHWAVIGNDDFKDQLLLRLLADGAYDRLVPPEVREALDGRVWPRELTSLLHEEAGTLAQRATDIALATDRNVVIDGTLGNRENSEDLLARLGAADYEVTIAAVDAPLHVAEARVWNRYLGDYLVAENGTATGATATLGPRPIPLEQLAHLYDDERSSLCLGVALELAGTQGCVAEFQAFRVEDADGPPVPTDFRGRRSLDGPVADEEALGAVATAARSVPPRARTRDAAPPGRPARRPGDPRRPGTEAER
jgi:chloramphenicol 3-O-phosphotransferase